MLCWALRPGKASACLQLVRRCLIQGHRNPQLATTLSYRFFTTFRRQRRNRNPCYQYLQSTNPPPPTIKDNGSNQGSAHKTGATIEIDSRVLEDGVEVKTARIGNQKRSRDKDKSRGKISSTPPLQESKKDALDQSTKSRAVERVVFKFEPMHVHVQNILPPEEVNLTMMKDLKRRLMNQRRTEGPERQVILDKVLTALSSYQKEVRQRKKRASEAPKIKTSKSQSHSPAAHLLKKPEVEEVKGESQGSVPSRPARSAGISEPVEAKLRTLSLMKSPEQVEDYYTGKDAKESTHGERLKITFGSPRKNKLPFFKIPRTSDQPLESKVEGGTNAVSFSKPGLSWVKPDLITRIAFKEKPVSETDFITLLRGNQIKSPSQPVDQKSIVTHVSEDDQRIETETRSEAIEPKSDHKMTFSGRLVTLLDRLFDVGPKAMPTEPIADESDVAVPDLEPSAGISEKSAAPEPVVGTDKHSSHSPSKDISATAEAVTRLLDGLRQRKEEETFDGARVNKPTKHQDNIPFSVHDRIVFESEPIISPIYERRLSQLLHDANSIDSPLFERFKADFGLITASVPEILDHMELRSNRELFSLWIHNDSEKAPNPRVFEFRDGNWVEHITEASRAEYEGRSLNRARLMTGGFFSQAEHNIRRRPKHLRSLSYRRGLESFASTLQSMKLEAARNTVMQKQKLQEMQNKLDLVEFVTEMAGNPGFEALLDPTDDQIQKSPEGEGWHIDAEDLFRKPEKLQARVPWVWRRSPNILNANVGVVFVEYNGGWDVCGMQPDRNLSISFSDTSPGLGGPGFVELNVGSLLIFPRDWQTDSDDIDPGYIHREFLRTKAQKRLFALQNQLEGILSNS